MLSATHNSQFTQSLLLFVSRSFLFFLPAAGIHIWRAQSQTQSGSRYTPHLTRFYASLSPSLLAPLIQESLESFHVKCKAASPDGSNEVRYRLRVGGYDRRRVVFKGWVDIEPFSSHGHQGSFCVMRRDVVGHLFFGSCAIRDQRSAHLRATQYHGASYGKHSSSPTSSIRMCTGSKSVGQDIMNWNAYSAGKMYDLGMCI